MCITNFHLSERRKVPLLALYAPTACGKTALCAELFGRGSLFFAEKGEIISADSMAVYRSLDIGTAKPSRAERENLPYHLVDICEIAEQFGAGEFVKKADFAAKEIADKKKLPVIAGGTGFYIKNFLLGLPPTPPSDPLVRQKIKARLEQFGAEKLHAELFAVDRESAAKIHKNDAFRICRALEVFEISGKPRSSFVMQEKIREQYEVCTVILTRSRAELYERIDKRVDEMFLQGLAKEAVELLSAGHTDREPGMQAIGYREFAKRWRGKNFLSSELDEIRAEIKKNSRRYAKKQFTCMTTLPNAIVFDAENKMEIIKKISDFCDYSFKTLDV